MNEQYIYVNVCVHIYIYMYVCMFAHTSFIPSATTHADLYLRARQRGVTVKVVHNASIMSAVAASGLQVI